jgi:alpha-galactosidase
MRLRVGLILFAAIFAGALLRAAASASGTTPPAARQAPGAVALLAPDVRDNGSLPFSFRMDGRLISSRQAGWNLKVRLERIDARRTRERRTLFDPKTGFAATCVSVRYSDFPVIEWTVYLEQTRRGESPLITDFNALDVRFDRNRSGGYVLHHPAGTTVSAGDYAPQDAPLPPGADVKIAPNGGRPCGGEFPYMNLQGPDGGVALAIGWPGHWHAEFSRDSAGVVHATAGQEGMRFKLRFGERVRSPLIAALSYRGDWIRGQNMWRRWMVAHNLPRPGGKLPPPQLNACYGTTVDLSLVNYDYQSFYLDRYVAEGLKPDYLWEDAGWYPNRSGWPNTGTWEVDTARFPGGLRPLTNHAHAKGVRVIVWFEPERVTPGTWLYEKHPEWLLGRDGDQKLLDLGNGAARRWLVDHIDGMLGREGIDLYRQDYNVDPLPYWRGADAPDRRGITENHYCAGYLAFWDELLRRRPNMLIDSCASGGHRNDLETMRRSVPLLRSDHILDAVGNQGHTYGLAFWIPFNGTGTDQPGDYEIMSAMTQAGFTACWDARNRSQDWQRYRKLVAVWRAVSPLYLADFYPLTTYNLDADKWIAWQWDSPERGQGAVQAFRRAKSPDEKMTLRLKALKPTETYVVADLLTHRAATLSGRELMQKGLTVEIPAQPGSAWLAYRVRRRAPP